MNYAFWSLVGQTQQIGLAQAQLHQLGNISGHLASQQAEQRRQSMLAQALYEVETAARSVGDVARSDPFAGAILSYLRSRSFSQISANMFSTIDSKRAWDAAFGALCSPWRMLESDRAWHDLGKRVVLALDEMILIRSQSGTADPLPLLITAEAELGDAERRAAPWRARAWLSFLLIPTTIVIAIVFSAIFHGMRGYEDPGGPIAAIGLLLVCPTCIATAIYLRVTRSARAQDVGRRVARLRASTDVLRNFMSRPDGGALLEFVAAKHPALR